MRYNRSSLLIISHSAFDSDQIKDMDGILTCGCSDFIHINPYINIHYQSC